MNLLAQIFIGFIALQHLGFLWLEMFAWETTGKKVFKGALAPDLFKPTKVMAANQGLYNGFLAAGLIWSLLITNAEWQERVGTFFLVCVIVAGIFGAITASKRILYVQGIPAAIALCLLLLS
jgi:putative membrane protein